MDNCQVAAGLLPNGSSFHPGQASSSRQLHYTTLPRNTHMAKSNGRVMRLPLDDGDGMLAMMDRNSAAGGPPNGIKVRPQLVHEYLGSASETIADKLQRPL